MKRRAWVRQVGILLGIIMLPSALAAESILSSFHRPAPSNQEIEQHPHRMQQHQVSVVIEILDEEQAESVFGVDLPKHGIQPVSVMVHNNSGETYRFRKAQVEPATVPTSVAARAACPNPVITGLRFVRWGVLVVPVSVLKFFLEAVPRLYVPTLGEWVRRPVTCSDVQADFAKGELADADVPPGGLLAGFLFTRPMPPGTAVHLSLIDARSQHPLVFERRAP